MPDQTPVPDKPTLVRGMDEDHYLGWLRHPVTRWFHQYLSDYAAALRRSHLEEWERGALDPGRDAELRARVLVHDEIIDLMFDHVLSFYGPDQPPDQSEEENATALHQNGAGRVRASGVDALVGAASQTDQR